MGSSSVVLLPYAPASVAAARWRLTANLREAGVFADAVGDAALVMSELLSNAILHARPLPGTQVQVSWALADGSVEVAVSDGGGSTRPRFAQPSLSSVGGRGLAIVERLASRWGVTVTDLGTTVWAVLPAPGNVRWGEGCVAGRRTGPAANRGLTAAAQRGQRGLRLRTVLVHRRAPRDRRGPLAAGGPGTDRDVFLTNRGDTS